MKKKIKTQLTITDSINQVKELFRYYKFICRICFIFIIVMISVAIFATVFKKPKVDLPEELIPYTTATEDTVDLKGYMKNNVLHIEFKR